MKVTLVTMLAELPPCEKEYRFHTSRRWRFDVCWPAKMVAFELEGVTPAGGRHQRIGGFEKDIEKYNTATLMGWTLIRATPRQVASGEAGRWLLEALQNHGG